MGTTAIRSIRTTRPAPRTVARLNVGDFDPTGPAYRAGVDVLAPIASDWSAAVVSPECPRSAAEQSSHGDLTARAALQLASLRAALDDAIRIDRAVGNKTAELARRLEQGLRFEQDMDRRLAEAGRSGQVLSQAGVALAGLERIVAELRGAHAGAECAFRVELAAQQARFDKRLVEHETRMCELLDRHTEAAAARLSEHSEAFAARIAEVSEQAQRALESAHLSSGAAQGHAMRLAANIERNVMAEANRLAAMLERQGAQVQARVALLVDGAAERLADLEQTGAACARAATEQVEALCDRAAMVLGHDPREKSDDAGVVSSHAPQSLAQLTERAEAAAHAADEAVLRISVATQRAEQVGAVEEQVGKLRDECEAMAKSARSNLAEVQQAEAILGKTIDRARDKAQTLDGAMDQVTEQARSMVEVARDVASLVLRAEQATGELAAAMEQTAQQQDADERPRAAGRIRRAPFGPPQAPRDEESAQAA